MATGARGGADWDELGAALGVSRDEVWATFCRQTDQLSPGTSVGGARVRDKRSGTPKWDITVIDLSDPRDMLRLLEMQMFEPVGDDGS